jgi:hypothetical protein
MLTTPHAVTGATLGAFLPVPFAIPAAIASHYILDSIPHWQETLAPYTPTKKTYIRIPLDIALAIGLTLLIAHWHQEKAGGIWMSAVSANLPDLDTIVILVPRLKRRWLRSYWDWHCKIQRETGSGYGVLTQLLVMAFGLYVSFAA